MRELNNARPTNAWQSASARERSSNFDVILKTLDNRMYENFPFFSLLSHFFLFLINSSKKSSFRQVLLLISFSYYSRPSVRLCAHNAFVHIILYLKNWRRTIEVLTPLPPPSAPYVCAAVVLDAPIRITRFRAAHVRQCSIVQ